MTDNHPVTVRSYNMSRIGSKNTKPEMVVRKYLFSNGFRFRLHDKKLPGKPDLVLKKYKTLLFIHGCFWHSHSNCKYATTPKSNVEYWAKKIKRNIERDKETIEKLSSYGWKVLVIWECDLKKLKIEDTLKAVIEEIIKTSITKV